MSNIFQAFFLISLRIFLRTFNSVPILLGDIPYILGQERIVTQGWSLFILKTIQTVLAIDILIR